MSRRTVVSLDYEFDRGMLTPSIVSFGATGKLFRGLVLPLIERLNRQGYCLGVVGVCTGEMERFKKLKAQEGLYTVREVGPDLDGYQDRLEMIESMRWILHSPNEPAAVLARLASPETELVTISITDKGYRFKPGSYKINLDDPIVLMDAIKAEMPQTPLGLILRSLERRQRTGLEPFAILPFENIPNSGDVIGKALLAMARKRDQVLGTDLAGWLESHQPFVLSSMVDKICDHGVPTGTQRCNGSPQLDQVPVNAELFGRLVVQDDPRIARLLPFELLVTDADGDFQFHRVTDVRPYELAKLWTVNGAHRLLGITGLLAGYERVDQAASSPEIGSLLETYLREVESVLPGRDDVKQCFDPGTLVMRFGNEALGDTLTRVAADSSLKLGARLFEPLKEMVAQGLPHDATTFAVACWLNFLRGENDQSGSFGFLDKTGASSLLGDAYAEEHQLSRLAQEVHAHWQQRRQTDPDAQPDVTRFVQAPALQPLFGELAQEPAFLQTLSSALGVLYAAGHGEFAGDTPAAISQWMQLSANERPAADVGARDVIVIPALEEVPDASIDIGQVRRHALPS